MADGDDGREGSGREGSGREGSGREGSGREGSGPDSAGREGHEHESAGRGVDQHHDHGTTVAPAHSPEERRTRRRLFVAITAPIAVLVVMAQVGDALAPQLFDRHPAWLIALNARNRNLLLTTEFLDPFTYYVVGTLRLLVSDPPFYLLGWFFGDAALSWTEQRSPRVAGWFRSLEDTFRIAAYPLVFIAPNNIICLLAGYAKMRPVAFFVANIAGTVVRLVLLRWFGDLFSSPIDAVQDFIVEYRLLVTMVTVSVVLGVVVVQRLKGGGELEGLRELGEEIEAED